MQADRQGETSTSAEKAYVSETYRVVDAGVTAARIWRRATTLGITRVANVTGLDYVGIPVFMVVRPASRNLSVMQGKGASEAAALASGLGEAVESYCSERVVRPVRLAAMESVVGDPGYLVPELLLRLRSPRDRPIPWTECRDVISGYNVSVPSEVIYADFTDPPPPGQGYFAVNTNGLAAGNSRDEALLHALCEVIERDAVALWMLRNREGRAGESIDVRTLTYPAAVVLISRLKEAGLKVEVWDITSDFGVPAFLCVIDDQERNDAISVGRIAGSGCHPSANVALCRAITEAAQARLTIIAGARDDVDFDIYSWMTSNAVFARNLPRGQSSRGLSFEDRSIASADLANDLRLMLGRLNACGIRQVVFADLPCPVDNFACVRVLVPELETMFEKTWYRPGKRARALARSLQ
jgi:ribosomal protein S12 methylthiotransferase accessory factor